SARPFLRPARRSRSRSPPLSRAPFLRYRDRLASPACRRPSDPPVSPAFGNNASPSCPLRPQSSSTAIRTPREIPFLLLAFSWPPSACRAFHADLTPPRRTPSIQTYPHERLHQHRQCAGPHSRIAPHGSGSPQARTARDCAEIRRGGGLAIARFLVGPHPRRPQHHRRAKTGFSVARSAPRSFRTRFPG